MVLDGVQELTAQWVTTWTHLRGLAVTEVDGWPLVHVASPSRETELVCVDPGADRFVELIGHVRADPRAMLTVAATDVAPYLAACLEPGHADGVRVDRDDEQLMSAALHATDVPLRESGLTARWDVDDRRVTYSLEVGGSVAAAGTVGVVGQVATFDRIETDRAFQRRGLGRHLMAQLTAHAIDRGATHGVLAASAQGHALYTALGWRTRLQMLSLMGTGPADA
jgi:GNAT superfamily N-acetyltransferase